MTHLRPLLLLTIFALLTLYGRGAPAEPASYLAPVIGELGREYPRNRIVNLVFHGHSVPAGYFKTPHVDTLNAYPAQLQRLLKERFPTVVLNSIVTAIGGEDSVRGAARFDRDVLTLRPDVVCIDYALNDRRVGLAAARTAWVSMIERAKAAGAKVILLTPTPDARAKLDDPNDLLVQLTAQVRGLAAEHGVALVDSLARFQEELARGTPLDDLLSQFNHPNTRGHALVAAALAEWFPALPPVGVALSNPVVPQRADPHITFHSDGYYYFTATVPEYDRLELRRARTLDGLAAAEPKTIWKKHATGPMGSHIWAPEMHFIKGKWYVYFAAGGAEKENVWNIRIYVLENSAANPLAGEWIERGQLKTNWESFALDATTFEHRGTRYLAWAQKDPKIKGNTNLYLAKMDSPTSIAGAQVMISKPEFPWEQIRYWVNEGPAVLVRNGRVWLTYSAAGTGSGVLSRPAQCRRQSRSARSGIVDEIADADFHDERSQRCVRPGSQQFHDRERRPHRSPRLPRAQLSRHQRRPAPRPEPPHAHPAVRVAGGWGAGFRGAGG
jgi:lysophospholipase L1-like esterase